jgi:hypothetical protein
MSEVTEQQLEDMEALFVQTAASMTSDRGTITLHGLSPSTLYFADRPKRDVGHMSSGHFVASWAEGDNSFADNPRTLSCRSRSRATGFPRMRSWSSRIRIWTGTRSPTASRFSMAPCPRPPGRVRCSSTRSGAPCHRSPPPGCTGVSAAGRAERPAALAGWETLLVPGEAARTEPS